MTQQRDGKGEGGCGPVLQLMRISDREPARWQRYGELFPQALRP